MEERDDQAPELHNSEQEDESGQAHTVADEALHPRHTGEGGDTVKAPNKGIDEITAPDLVDHMRDMERSGRIDMSAYRGEPSMDDEEDAYGNPKRNGDED